MATAINPRIVDMATVEKTRVKVSAAFTGSMGVPIVLTAGQAVLAADDEIPWGCLGETIATALNENTYVDAFRWRPGTRLEIYVCSGGTASTIVTTNKGKAYDYELVGTGVSAVGYLDKAAASDLIFRVIDLASEYEPSMNAATDSPGKCIVEVLKVQTA